MSDDREEHAELYRFAELARRYPQLAPAIIADEPDIAVAVAKWTDRDLRFLTRVTDAPLIAEGYLTPAGVWRIWCCHFVLDDRCEAQLEDAIVAREADEFFLAMGELGERIIRWAVSRYLATPPGEAPAAFERRIAQTRFAPNLTLH